MAYSHLFIDSDILPDMLLDRNPFFSQMLLTEGKERGINLSTSALVVANIYYILSKMAGATLARKQIEKLVDLLNILSVESESISLALKSKFNDFEDGYNISLQKSIYVMLLSPVTLKIINILKFPL